MCSFMAPRIRRPGFGVPYLTTSSGTCNHYEMNSIPVFALVTSKSRRVPLKLSGFPEARFLSSTRLPFIFAVSLIKTE